MRYMETHFLGSPTSSSSSTGSVSHHHLHSQQLPHSHHHNNNNTSINSHSHCSSPASGISTATDSLSTTPNTTTSSSNCLGVEDMATADVFFSEVNTSRVARYYSGSMHSYSQSNYIFLYNLYNLPILHFFTEKSSEHLQGMFSKCT